MNSFILITCFHVALVVFLHHVLVLLCRISKKFQKKVSSGTEMICFDMFLSISLFRHFSHGSVVSFSFFSHSLFDYFFHYHHTFSFLFCFIHVLIRNLKRATLTLSSSFRTRQANKWYFFLTSKSSWAIIEGRMVAYSNSYHVFTPALSLHPARRGQIIIIFHFPWPRLSCAFW